MQTVRTASGHLPIIHCHLSIQPFQIASRAMLAISLGFFLRCYCHSQRNTKVHGYVKWLDIKKNESVTAPVIYSYLILCGGLKSSSGAAGPPGFVRAPRFPSGTLRKVAAKCQPSTAPRSKVFCSLL